ncbi:helix-turn-helix transcriptional regulator [Paenibacillus xanthanilyticus]|uniref:Helix-turn-helix transcriptional regulator n=1 Tax=Paenibacillus xanthanilyticus TaxID=1783531 RepID=A0ABV8JWK2_9BACL
MKKTERLVELLLTINTRQKFTLKELADRFDVSKRTVLRDMNELSAMGVPIYAELGVHGGYRILKERSLPPITFAEQEAEGLFLVAQSLTHYRDLPLESNWRSALAKFYRILPEDAKSRIDALRRRLLFGVPDRPVETPLLPALLEGALEQKRLRISYASEHGETEIDVQLVGLYAMNGLWYCPAYDGRSGEYRLFRADRVRRVAQSEDQSALRDHGALDIADWFRAERDRTESRETHRLCVRLTKRGVTRCRGDAWLGSGLTMLEDGTGYIRRGISPDYMAWAASFFIGCGADAVVEEPSELRRMIVKQLRETMSVYEEVGK